MTWVNGAGASAPALVALAARIESAIAAWGRRDEPDAGAEVRRSATAAVDGIDELLRTLYRVREDVVSEARGFDEDTNRRVDELLARYRGGETS